MVTMLTATNPLREGLRTELSAEPCVVVIFGATGDLTHRKLVPALYHLALERRLPVARHWSGLRGGRGAMMASVIEPGGGEGERRRDVPSVGGAAFAEAIRYVQASFEEPEGYHELKRVCDELDATRGTRGNRLYYLATAPNAYSTIIKNLGAAGLVRRSGQNGASGGWTRIVVEKPFGTTSPRPAS